MASSPIRDLSEYPRPWFYRPEVYYGFFIFPPVWSILTLRSPWHKGEGFRGIMVGGVAWFIMIASVVLSVRWVQEDGGVNLFIFVPGILLTVVTQVQWAAHLARHGPPPIEQDGDQEHTGTLTAAPDDPSQSEHEERAIEAEGDKSGSEPVSADDYAPRRRRRRRRRPISRSADPDMLC